MPPQHSPQASCAHSWATHSTFPGHPASYAHGAWAHQYQPYPYAHAPLPTPGLAQPVPNMSQYLATATGHQAYPYQPVTTPVFASAGFDYHSLPAHHQNFVLTVATACWKDQYAVLEQKNKQLEARLAVEKQRYEAVALKVNRLKAAPARGGDHATVGVVSDSPAGNNGPV